VSRTRIRSRFLIAWDGVQQRLIPGGELVFAGDRVQFVGKNYQGQIDQEIDASTQLVMPGFVNLHCHAGHLAMARLFSDYGRREPYSLGFLNYAAPRSGAASPLSTPASESAALCTLAELLRYGCTTVVEIGGETGVDPAVVKQVAPMLGVRVVVGKGFRSSDYVSDDAGTVRYHSRSDGGRAALTDAIHFAETLVTEAHPLVSPMLFPLQADTCEPWLLKEAYRAAEELGIKLQLHAAQGLFEVHTIMQRSGKLPITYLDSLGVLGPRTLLAHAVFISGHPWLPYRLEGEIERLAASGAGVIHCPQAFARRGFSLSSFERYRQAGIRVAVGTDTFPRDMIQELRWASYLCKVEERDFAAANAWDVFSAATNVAADLLERPDLGRLATGTQADFITVNLDSYRIGPVYDPLSALVHAGTGDDICDVYVAGQPRVLDGEVLGVDRAELLRQQALSAERAWEALPEWHPQAMRALDISMETAARLWEP
jgi:5-methylthioadenosine/S-adenosylhomocysteine deaminase